MNGRPWSGRGARVTALAAVALAGAPRRSGPVRPVLRDGRRPDHDRGRLRPGGARPPHRRHRHGIREPRDGRAIPGRRHPLRDDAVEPRHQPERRPVRRRVRLLRQQHQRLQPHPPQRHRVPLVPGHPDPPDGRHRREHSRGDRRLVLARRRSTPPPAATRSSSARRPSPSRSPSPRAPASRASIPARHGVQRALQGGRQRQSGHRGERAGSGARRGRGPGHQRAVLPDGDQLHPALRRRLQPSLLLDRHLGRIRHDGRQHHVHGLVVRRLRDVRHERPAARAHEGRDLLRQHRQRRAEPQFGGSRVVGPAGGRAGSGQVEHPPRPHRRRGRHRCTAAHLLHGAVPLAPVPQRRVGRERPVPRQ